MNSVDFNGYTKPPEVDDGIQKIVESNNKTEIAESSRAVAVDISKKPVKLGWLASIDIDLKVFWNKGKAHFDNLGKQKTQIKVESAAKDKLSSEDAHSTKSLIDRCEKILEKLKEIEVSICSKDRLYRDEIAPCMKKSYKKDLKILSNQRKHLIIEAYVNLETAKRLGCQESKINELFAELHFANGRYAEAYNLYSDNGSKRKCIRAILAMPLDSWKESDLAVIVNAWNNREIKTDDLSREINIFLVKNEIIIRERFKNTRTLFILYFESLKLKPDSSKF